MGWRYLDLYDYLALAERVLGVRAERLARRVGLGRADAALNAPSAGYRDVDAYPDFTTKVTVLGWHLIRNRPLPDANKRCAVLAMAEFAARNGRLWRPEAGDGASGEVLLGAVAGGTVEQGTFMAWVEQRVAV